MDKSVKRHQLPDELESLIQGRRQPRPDQGMEGWHRRSVLNQGLSGTAASRLRELARAEEELGFSLIRPAWSSGQAIPRLQVLARLERSDAYGASRLLADLDLSARRAGALYRLLLRDGEAKRWPEPLRTHEGGLRLLNARVGSFEIVMTFWGSLAMIASSSPVAVAGMMSLAWDVGRGSIRLADRWFGAASLGSRGDTPSLEHPEHAQQWGVRHTKALAPVLEAAALNGSGAELVVNEIDRTVKLSVLPRDSSGGIQS